MGKLREGGLGRRRRLAFVTARKMALVLISAAGAWLFLNHDRLYLRADVDPNPASLEAYALATAVIYVFILAVAFVAGRPAPGPRPMRCPSCGRALTGIGSADPEEHRGSPSAGGATDPAVAFQNAVRASRLVAIGGPAGSAHAPPALPGGIEDMDPDRAGGGAPRPGPAKRILREPWEPSWLKEDRPGL